LIIQAFPSSEFGGQEFAKNEDIAAFVAARGFVGPNAMLMDKVKVNGSSSSPVFKFLKNRVGQVLPIKWNFDGKVRQSAVSLHRSPTRLSRMSTRLLIQYLVRKDGTTVTRYSATQSPLSFEDDIKAALNE